MHVIDIIRNKRADVYKIADRNKVDKLYVFGSCARKEETADSDIDFLARFRKGASLFDMSAIVDELKMLFGMNVDVVSVSSLARSPRFADQVMRDLVAI